MSSSSSDSQSNLRLEIRQWLKENVPTPAELEGLDDPSRAILWETRKHAGGWACMTWPEEYGGRGAGALEAAIWQEEESRFDVPVPLHGIGHGMAGPTLMKHGSEAQKSEFLPAIISGEEIWCQLFSEPAGGSDLAALRTAAVKDGEDWVINGQKIWTSAAQHARRAILVARTDNSVPKHQGLTYFVVDMDTPGIEVRPIKQMNGDTEFNEVFLTDVRIPDSRRIGDVGQGWQVALTTLANERASLGEGFGEIFLEVDTILDIASKATIDGMPAIDNALVQNNLAEWYCQESGLRNILSGMQAALSRGSPVGPEASIIKLVAGAMSQDLASFAMDLLEESGAAWDNPGRRVDTPQDAFMLTPGIRIAGGTDEIQKNIIAERILGLPQEERADKNVPFSEIPTGR